MLDKVLIKTDYGSHICNFKSDGEGGFIVTAPNVPGMITWGKNFAHAKKMAKECLELCIECLVDKQLHKKESHAMRTAKNVPA